MIGRLGTLGDPCPAAPALRAFPSATRIAKATEQRLRTGTRLGYRVPYLRTLAAEVASGSRDLERLEADAAHLTSDEVARALRTIRGVGPGSVPWLLMMLGHYDRPVIDRATLRLCAMHPCALHCFSLDTLRLAGLRSAAGGSSIRTSRPGGGDMLRYLVLGLLRDGKARHGYGMMTEYRARSGEHVSMGNLYRELARLSEEELAQTGINPPGADPRRIVYQITERGVQIFDQWFLAPIEREQEISARLVFLDQLPADRLARLLDRWQEDLWVRGKTITQARDDALARGQSPPRFSALASLLSRQLKYVSAELEFLKEFREEFDAWTARRATPQPLHASPVPTRASSRRSRRSEA